MRDICCKVSLLAEHGKHAQDVHNARARLQVVSLPLISHHFRSSIIPDSDSVFLLLFHFIYYKKPMYTTFSVVESIPPLTSRHRPVLFSSPQSSSFRSVRQSSSLIKSRSREAPSSRSRSRTPSQAHEKLSTFTLSSRLTKSTPVHDPHLNPPSLPFHEFRSVPISDDR